MEIKGEEFIKTVQIRQEKDEIQKRLEEIESHESMSSQEPETAYEEEIMQTESELDDIMLQTPTPNNENNKKKYIVLGLILVVLFLLTVIVFRLLTNPSEENLADKDIQITQDKALGNDNIEQQYQKIINEKLQDIKEQNRQTEIQEKSTKTSLDLKSIEKEEQKLPAPKKSSESVKKAKELKEDIFGIKDAKKVAATTPPAKKSAPVTKTAPKKDVNIFKNVETKKVAKPTVAVKTPTTTAKGSYIQIGAFSKSIDNKYLDNLKTQGIKYIFHKVTIKGVNYTKVLVGPYSSKKAAQNDLTNIKTKLKLSSAYVLSI